MRVVIAMGLLAPSIDSSFLTPSQYGDLPFFDVDDGSGERLADVLASGLRGRALGSAADSRNWWLGQPRATGSGAIEVCVRPRRRHTGCSKMDAS